MGFDDDRASSAEQAIEDVQEDIRGDVDEGDGSMEGEFGGKTKPAGESSLKAEKANMK